jgi:hypothetical protein
VPEVSDASSGGTVRAAARLGSGESVGDTGAVLILVIFGEN